ncbi:DNA-directed RNA polymerase, subunit L [Candidatus Nitrososphaera evergladensis SR1]|jgi:DNA-directed RNA polymerase subunit L|uniref:DNA-directed RNA polymerase subunit Rpo11 n=1 Tax=Candidatus Nitrososphaera evergladensis SR1 TaxID=1459636 RepID=A0A075MQ66_9ARCH|nr:RpoL/Rpb11 RNA polymerase subunit family protein [Candidatus Nitrososphaera evergladensis]AIF83022.1 DNA-directed RNA polymerase, subunit L [Candidatus Nitrososphaera evergladensis SR1]
MLAEITDFKDNELELKVREEDISILYIVQHELLKEKSVDFAGVMLQHPLTKDFKMRVVTKRKDPAEVIQDAAVSAADYSKELAGLVKAALK